MQDLPALYDHTRKDFKIIKLEYHYIIIKHLKIMIYSAFARNYVYILKPVFPPRFDKMHIWTDHVIRGYWYQFVIFNLSSFSIVSSKRNKHININDNNNNKTKNKWQKTNKNKKPTTENMSTSRNRSHFIFLLHVDIDMTPRPNVLFLMDSFANL